MKRYAMRVGEPLAIDPSAIRRDGDGFYLMMGDAPAPENETLGSVVVVHVRGALTQFKGDGGDSYEAIVERTAEAFAQDPKPSTVVYRISSPGGVVAGLFECAAKLRRMAKSAGVELVGFVDELAASAAYGICCGCSTLYAPASAVIGSIGVISTMCSVVGADEAQGVEYRLITSGARKADGHLHAPITDAGEKAERSRNADLAAQFFALAASARKVSTSKIAALEAGIFLGKKAEKVGLIDEVCSLDDALYALGADVPDPRHPVARAVDFTSPTSKDDPMAVRLLALIRSAEASLATETDPKKKLALEAKLSALRVARAEMDEDDEDEDKKDPDDEEEASKAEKAKAAADKAKRSAEAAKHRAKAAEHRSKAAESEEAAKNCEDGGGEDEAAMPDAVRAALAEAPEGGGALGVAMAALARQVGELTAAKAADTRAALLAKAKPFVPPHMLAAVKGLGLADLQAFVTEATKGEPLVVTSEGGLVKPNTTGGATALPRERLASIEEAVRHAGVADKDAFRAKLVEAHTKAHAEEIKASNGGSARY
jgi:ClpP class serine protease